MPVLQRTLSFCTERYRDWRLQPGNIDTAGNRVLVASIPRCGSTMLVRALAGFPAGQRLPWHPQIRFCRTLEKLPDARLLKTHSLAPARLPADVRVVFLFGDPVGAVYSTLQKRFDRHHFNNCGYFARELPDIIHRDDLGYERIWNSWNAAHPYPVLLARFESLWTHQAAIENYLGISLQLPAYKARQTLLEPVLRHNIESTYSSLITKINRAPDIALNSANAV